MAGLLSKISIVLGIAFLLAGAASLFWNLDSENRTALADYGLENPWNATKAGAKVILGYDMTTPSFIHERFGDPETQTFMFEDTPYPDSKDFLILVPYWLICFLIVRFMFRSQNISNGWSILMAILLFTIGTILIWSLWKILWYRLLISGAEDLGITEGILEARKHVSTTAAKGFLWIMLITVANSIILIRALWPGGGKE